MSYAYSRSITISHALAGTASSASFPLLFSGTYSYLAGVPNGGSVHSANGYDIVFTSDSAGATILPFERVSYNSTTGAVEFWVNIPSLSATVDTVIYLFYGNSSSTTDHANPTGTWDSNFQGVYHFGSGGTLTASDSTINAHNGTISGATEAPGQVGDGASFVLSSAQSIDLGSPFNFASGAFSVSTWVQFNGTFASGVYPIILSCLSPNGQNGWELILADPNGSPNGNYLYIQCWNAGANNQAPGQYAGTAITEGSFVHCVVTYDPSTDVCHVYNNGIDSRNSPRTLNSSVIGVSASDLRIGLSVAGSPRVGWTGVIDEVHFSNVVRTPSFVTASYNNQLSPSSFYSVGVALGPQRGRIAFDQVRASNRFGSGAAFQMAGGTSAVVGNVPVYTADGSIVDSGVPPGSGGGITISVNGTPV